jgi:AraC-like DNA-binding protein
LRDVQKTLPTPPGETAPHLDVLSEVLRTVRLTGATFFSAEFRAPWGFTSPPIDTVAKTLQDPDAHLVLFHLVLEGRATARVEGAPDITLEAGDIVAFPQGHAHRVWQGRPGRWYDTGPAVRRALAGELQVTRTGGVGGATRFVCGYFSCDRWASEVILAGLPSMFTVSVRDGDRPGWLEDAIQFLAAEAASDHAGRGALLTKLSEALFVETLRRWMTALPAEHTSWLAGARDDVVGRALALLHRQPSRRWTLDALARDAGASRSTLAERFAHYLQEPPMTYLARWRLQLGARLLTTTHQSVLEVAGRVGYESEAAFNRAFRREYGLPPGRYRHAARTPAIETPGPGHRTRQPAAETPAVGRRTSSP